jgi:hypothetical protein
MFRTSVPEAAVHENGEALFAEHEVGFAEQNKKELKVSVSKVVAILIPNRTINRDVNR